MVTFLCASSFRTKEKRDAQTVKPSSAKARSKETNAGTTDGERQLEPRRAKSVPLQGRNTARLEGVDEEDEEQVATEAHVDTPLRIPDPPDRGILRPTTSILRPSQLINGLNQGEKDDSARPKTTHSRRRVALDSFINQDSFPNTKHSEDVTVNNENNDDTIKPDSGPPSHRSAKGTGGEKSEGERRRTISINECPQIVDSCQQGPQSPRPSLVHARAVGERVDLEDRMPGLAATRIATRNTENTLPIKPVASRKAHNGPKKLNSVQAGTVVFPKVKHVVPELGTDSPLIL